MFVFTLNGVATLGHQTGERKRNFAKINEYECNEGNVFSSNISVSHAYFFTSTYKYWYPKIATPQK